MNNSDRHLFLIGGPNGAGKTTSAFSLMPELIHCNEYVNADSIAASLSPFNPESTAIQAGKLMLKRIYDLAEQNVSFAFETTMASKSFIKLIKSCKEKGYQINLLYLWLVSPDLAVKRVESRVKSGGHSIPENVITRRYERSMNNFMNLYIPLADRWAAYDNSTPEPVIIAQKHLRSKKLDVHIEKYWDLLRGINNE